MSQTGSVWEEDEKKSSLTAEDITNPMVIQLDKKEDRQNRSEGTGLTSPIPQVDGSESTILTLPIIPLSVIIIRLSRLLNLHKRTFYQDIVLQDLGSSLTSSCCTV